MVKVQHTLHAPAGFLVHINIFVIKTFFLHFRYIREFVKNHPSYNKDSVVSEEVCYNIHVPRFPYFLVLLLN